MSFDSRNKYAVFWESHEVPEPVPVLRIESSNNNVRLDPVGRDGSMFNAGKLAIFVAVE